MRKLIVLFLLLDCGYCSIFAQNKTLDSLNQLLATEKEDTSKVLLMNSIALRIRSFKT